jgi:hypothetical protein
VIHDLSNRFQLQSRPVRLRLYSKYPFPNRFGRKLDDFARAALSHFEATTDDQGIRDRQVLEECHACLAESVPNPEGLDENTATEVIALCTPRHRCLIGGFLK